MDSIQLSLDSAENVLQTNFGLVVDVLLIIVTLSSYMIQLLLLVILENLYVMLTNIGLVLIVDVSKAISG